MPVVPVQLATVFLRIGALAFGGLGATVALINHDLVERRKLASSADVTDALTYTKLLPGSTVVQVVAFLGWRLGGWLGSGLATVAFLLPSCALMLALAYGNSFVAAYPAFGSVRRGVLAAVVALLLLTLYRLGRQLLTTRLATGLAAATFVAAGLLDVNGVWLVLIAGLLGVMMKLGGKR